MVLLLVVASVAAIYDYKFILVAFMIVLIVLPMIMSFVYFKYALHPLSRYSILPKVIEFDSREEALALHILDVDDNITEFVRYKLSDFDAVSFGSSNVSFRYRLSRYTYLILPVKAFSQSEIEYLMNRFMPEIN